MGAVGRLADRYVDELDALDPCEATGRGITTYDHLLTDHSPEGEAARAELTRRTLQSLDALTPDDAADERCAELLGDRLRLRLDLYDAGEHLRALRIIGSPVEGLRAAFDQMPRDTDDAWAVLAARLDAVPAAYAQLRESVALGIERGVLAAPRQADACAEQLATWAGIEPGSSSFWAELAAGAPAALRTRLDTAITAADRACAELADWLRTTYRRAAADVPDAVGAEAYERWARQWLGARLDVADAYAWAWDDLAAIEADMAATAERIVPGATIDDAMRHLDRHGDAVHSAEALRDWLQELVDRTIDELGRDAFTIAEPLRRCEVMLAPPGSAAAQYYTVPSPDFSRPGRTWNPASGRARFPLWNEVSTCFHESVPGHHLQLATWVHLAPQLGAYATSEFVSGNIEGWALYAEWFMDERGAFTDPGQRMGYLVAQQLRATRVIVDLGMHHALRFPTGQPFHPGEVMTPELGRQFLFAHAGTDEVFLASEWVRYLGWPAQAISYKLGQRVWLEGRDAARARAAADGRPFDLKAWHAAALGLGSTGLDALARLLPTLA